MMGAIASFVPPPAEDPLLLDIRSVARLLTVSEKTVERMVKSGELTPPIRLNKRNIRWSRVAIEQWISNRTAGAAIDGGSSVTLSLVPVSED
jgi:predicted DNA-binding transcriptional regulator AlpA